MMTELYAVPDPDRPWRMADLGVEHPLKDKLLWALIKEHVSSEKADEWHRDGRPKDAA